MSYALGQRVSVPTVASAAQRRVDTAHLQPAQVAQLLDSYLVSIAGEIGARTAAASAEDHVRYASHCIITGASYRTGCGGRRLIQRCVCVWA